MHDFWVVCSQLGSSRNPTHNSHARQTLQSSSLKNARSGSRTSDADTNVPVGKTAEG